MQVWMDGEGSILYKHYEKTVASRQVLNFSSAHSSTCKRNVHIQEVMRRILNCSARLDWQEEVAPVIDDYMARMRSAGYKERTIRKEQDIFSSQKLAGGGEERFEEKKKENMVC